MSKALSLDLRVRVLAAVEAGATHREAGERFGVSPASVSRWGQRKREEGEPRPKALGGDRRSGRIEAHHDAVLAALGPAKDATIEEVRLALSQQSALSKGFGYPSAHSSLPSSQPSAETTSPQQDTMQTDRIPL